MKTKLKAVGILAVTLCVAISAYAAISNIKSQFVGGNLHFQDKATGNDIMTIHSGTTGIEIEQNVIGDGAATLGGFVATVVNGSTATLTISQSGNVFTNFGETTLVTLTLPAAAAGLVYPFADVVTTAGVDLWITAGSGDKINFGTAGKSYKCVTDSVRQTTTLTAIDSTNWIVTAEQGTWANDNS